MCVRISIFIFYQVQSLAYWFAHTYIQVNLCQKLFLNQLTHNMTRDCSLNSRKIQVDNVLCTIFLCCFVLTFRTILVYNMLSTCIFCGIQWTISCQASRKPTCLALYAQPKRCGAVFFSRLKLSLIFLASWCNLAYRRLTP